MPNYINYGVNLRCDFIFLHINLDVFLLCYLLTKTNIKKPLNQKPN